MTERKSYPRSKCVVPFCRRTSTRFAGEWICGDHWRMVPRDQKLLRTRIRRRMKKRWEKLKAIRDACANDTKEQWMAHRRFIAVDALWTKVEDAIWRRMKKAAIERATGL